MSLEQWLERIGTLLVAASKFLWPMLVLVAIIMFRKDIRTLLRRLRKGKLLGQEVELGPEIEEFRKSTELAQGEASPQVAPTSSQPESPPARASASGPPQNDSGEVLSLAITSPELAIIQLARLIENELRLLLGDLGLLSSSTPVRPVHDTVLLAAKGFLPKNTVHSLSLFWRLRNQLVHGQEAPEKREVLAVIDVGLSLLQTLRSLPHEINRVYKTDIRLFEDSQCLQPREGVVGVVLETESPGGFERKLRIFPTTQIGYYRAGKRVSWEWDFMHTWKDTWYRDPKSQAPQLAWSTSAEFVGRQVD